MNLKLQKLSKVSMAFLMALFSVWGYGQVTQHTFATTSGSITSNISFTTAQNSSSTAPGIFGDGLRLYPGGASGGGSITITPANGFIITKVKFFATQTQPVRYSINGGTAVSMAATSTYEINGTISSSLKLNNANTGTSGSTNQLRLSSVEVTYQTLANNPPVVTASLFTGSVGTTFTESVQATENPTSYTLESGNIPPGLIFNTTSGSITGTPSTSGSFTANISATNSLGTSTLAAITFDIAKGNQNATLSNLNVNIGAANVTLPSVTNSGLNINYVSSNPAVASVSGNTLTYGNIGTATITASNAGDANYLPFNGTFTAIVNFNAAVVPVANAATAISSNSFTANWNTVSGADSYRLDVYQTSGSVTPNVPVVGWTFEDQDAIADTGLTANNTSAITTNASGLNYTNMTNNPISDGYVVTTSGGWNSGNNTKYWKVNLVTTGITNLKLSSVQRSSNTGPRDFKVQYSLDDSAWTDVSGSTVTVGNDWSTGALSNIALPTNCENKSVVYLRWIMTSNTSANNGTVAAAGTSAIDNITVIGDQGTFTNNYILQNQNVGNVTSYSVTSLAPNAVYHYVVRGVNGAANTVSSNEITVTTTASLANTIWNGTAWSNGTPSSSLDAIISSNYTGNGFTAQSMTVNPNTTLTINSGQTITTGNTTNNGNIIVNDGGNFIQNVGATYTAGTGSSFVANRNSTSAVNKYVFWSSPVVDQNIFTAYTSGSSATAPTYVMTYNTGTNFYDLVTNADGNFVANSGKGYSVKVPQANAGVLFGGTNKTPNNGIVNISLAGTTGGLNNFNLIGNPYPSNLDLTAFYNANNTAIGSTLWFWDNTTGNVTTQTGSTATNVGYATINAASGTWTEAPGTQSYNSATLSGFGSIAKIGQGFIVKSVDAGQVSFTNAMRTSTAGVTLNKNLEVNAGKFWIKLTTSYGNTVTQAVTYSQNALNDYDVYDSKAMGTGSDAFYSLAGTEKVIIQGRAPFNINDVVSLGTKHFENGNFTVSLAHKEGLFTNGQAIYLHDKSTGTFTDLQNQAYTFTANAGEFTNRFEIVYKLNVLATSEVQKDSFEVYRDGEDFFVRNNKNIENIEIFDAAGRKVQDIDSNSKLVRIKLELKGLYIIKAESAGQEYSKKVIK
jgi:hypothetical protein